VAGGRLIPHNLGLKCLRLFCELGRCDRDSEDLSDTPSNVVRRFAALALYANGSRSDAMALRNEYANSSPLTRLAILLAARKLGNDERRHWRRTLQLTGVLERLL
jgi:hypothetical protein